MSDFKTFLLAILEMLYRGIEVFLEHLPFILVLIIVAIIGTLFGVDTDMSVKEWAIVFGGIIVVALLASAIGVFINFVLPEQWQTRISYGGSALISEERRRLLSGIKKDD